MRRTAGSSYDPKIQKGDSSKNYTSDNSIAVDQPIVKSSEEYCLSCGY